MSYRRGFCHNSILFIWESTAWKILLSITYIGPQSTGNWKTSLAVVPNAPKTRLVPKTPRARFHVGYARSLNGQNFSTIVDAYSEWPKFLSWNEQHQKQQKVLCENLPDFNIAKLQWTTMSGNSHKPLLFNSANNPKLTMHSNSHTNSYSMAKSNE